MTGVPPWEITDSFLAIRTERPSAARDEGSFPAAPAVPDENAGFPRDGESFHSRPAEPPRVSGGSDLFSRSTGTPSFPPGGGSFPGGPPQPPDSPGATLPGRRAADAPGENTENIPAVAPPSEEGKLPRRVPLSERASGFPPVQRRQDDDAFRLFPFGKNAETPPTDSSEDQGG